MITLKKDKLTYHNLNPFVLPRLGNYHLDTLQMKYSGTISHTNTYPKTQHSKSISSHQAVRISPKITYKNLLIPKNG